MANTRTLTVRNLKANVAIADSQFVVPKDYKIKFFEYDKSINRQ